MEGEKSYMFQIYFLCIGILFLCMCVSACGRACVRVCARVCVPDDLGLELQIVVSQHLSSGN